MYESTIVKAPPPAEVLIPEARYRQRRRYRRSASLVLIVVLLAGVLLALLISTTSSGSGTAPATSKPSVVAATRATVLIRPVLCFAPPYVASQAKSSPLPGCGGPYLQSNSNLGEKPNTSVRGYSTNLVGPDPTLAGYPSSTHDVPSHTVLLAGLSGPPPTGGRYVLGPSEMRLSAADVESASAHRSRTGQWMVTVHLSSDGAAAFDRVAQENFHLLVAIDMGGKVVSAPLIQPTQTSFSSFDGVLQVSGNLSASIARTVAAAVKG
jgi:hypothetical protein